MRPAIIRRFPSLLLLLATMLMTAAAVSAERTWTVIASSGTIALTGADGSESLDARTGAQLATPFSIRTGGDGHLVIARGKDVMTIGPGARLEIPAPAPAGQGLVTRIHQALGSILYQVEHRLKETFEVHTPYLVSVVKGTTFNILVSADSATVALIEGRLQVYTPDNLYESYLEAGQVAVKKVDGNGIRIEDQRSLSEPVAGPIRIGREDELLASAVNDPAPGSDGLATRQFEDANLSDGNIETRLVSNLSVDLDGAGMQGASVGDSSLLVGSVTLSDDGLLGAGIAESSVSLGGISAGETALTPALEIGELSADLGGGALDIGNDLGVGLTIDDTSIALDGVSIGGTALTPSLDVGSISAGLGGVDIALGGELGTGLGLGDISLELDEVMLGATALTPELGLSDTSLNLGESNIGLSTELDAGILDTIELDVEVETTLVTDTVDMVGNIVDETASTLSPVIGSVTGALGLF